MATIDEPSGDVSVVVSIRSDWPHRERALTMTVSSLAIRMLIDSAGAVPDHLLVAGWMQGRDLDKELLRQALLPLFERAAGQAARVVAEDYVSEVLGIESRNPKPKDHPKQETP